MTHTNDELLAAYDRIEVLTKKLEEAQQEIIRLEQLRAMTTRTYNQSNPNLN